MKSKFGFPIKLSAISLILTLSVFYGLIFLLHRAYKDIEQIQKIEFPFLLMSSSSLRLVEQSNYLLEMIIKEKQVAKIDEFLSTYEAYQLALDESESFYRSSFLYDNQNALPFVRLKNTFNDPTTNFLNLIKAHEFEKAEKVYQKVISDKYLESRESLSQVAFNLSKKHDSKLISNNQLFYIFFIASLIGLGLVITLWFFVFIAYKKNKEARENAEAELEKERVKSIHNSKMSALGEMASGVAHEINNPLTIIQGVVTITIKKLQTSTEPKELALESFDKILKVVERIAKIVKSMRTISRDASSDPMVSVNIYNMVDEILSFSKQRLSKFQIELINQINPEIKCECRQIEIEQVLLNLLNNSIDAIESLSVKDNFSSEVETTKRWIK
ncbi:MAG: hypothetical protein L6Q37_04110, partial [Bdellovibrionaceae bacterium]|nr:hypothetical protein [Pseudobdellovibrionaceae bacterium]